MLEGKLITIRAEYLIFVLGHYLFLEAHSFPRATLSDNCWLLGTVDVRGHISVHISRLLEAIVYLCVPRT